MLKKILIVLVVLVAGFLVVVALQPAAFHIERSATITAPAAHAFALVNDFHNWERWSPFAKRDPNQKTTYEGAPAGLGAIQHWAGNSEVGEGRMTITESSPNQKVGIKLEFISPFEAVNQADFTFAAAGEGTKVTWSTYGENGFMAKAFGLFVDMDKMLGADFEQGLAAMKVAAEEDAKKAAEEEAKAVAAAAAAEAAAAAAAQEAVAEAPTP